MKIDKRSVKNITTEELELILQESKDRSTVAAAIVYQNTGYFGKRENQLARELMNITHEEALFMARRVEEIQVELVVRGEGEVGDPWRAVDKYKDSDELDDPNEVDF